MAFAYLSDLRRSEGIFGSRGTPLYPLNHLVGDPCFAFEMESHVAQAGLELLILLLQHLEICCDKQV